LKKNTTTTANQKCLTPKLKVLSTEYETHMFIITGEQLFLFPLKSTYEQKHTLQRNEL